MKPRTISIAAAAASALCLIIPSGCASSGPRSNGGPKVSHSINVDISDDGAPMMFGEPISFGNLVSRLKKRGADEGMPVAIYCSEKTSRTAVLSLMRRLNQEGIPNISVVSAAKVSSTLVDDTNGLPGEPEKKPMKNDTPKSGSGKIRKGPGSLRPPPPKINYR